MQTPNHFSGVDIHWVAPQGIRFSLNSLMLLEKQNRHLIVSPYTHLALTLPIILIWHHVITGLPRGTSGKEASCQCRTHETCTGSLGWEAPLEKETATPSSILAWRIPWTEEPGRLRSMGVTKSQTWLKHLSTHIHMWLYLVFWINYSGTLGSRSYSGLRFGWLVRRFTGIL